MFCLEEEEEEGGGRGRLGDLFVLCVAWKRRKRRKESEVREGRGGGACTRATSRSFIHAHAPIHFIHSFSVYELEKEEEEGEERRVRGRDTKNQTKAVQVFYPEQQREEGRKKRSRSRRTTRQPSKRKESKGERRSNPSDPSLQFVLLSFNHTHVQEY